MLHTPETTQFLLKVLWYVLICRYLVMDISNGKYIEALLLLLVVSLVTLINLRRRRTQNEQKKC